MKTKSTLGALLVVAMLCVTLYPIDITAQSEAMKMRDKRVELSNTMRKLWDDHVVWTRLFIISATAGLTDLDATIKRLLQNQTDIGNLLKPYYGDPAGDEMTRLLRDHIVLAGDLITAARDKNKDMADVASERWHANADTIAVFLYSANPEYWKLEEMQAMLDAHLDLTLEEVTHRIRDEHLEEIATYDKIRDQALRMADMLTDGIIMQHQDKLN